MTKLEQANAFIENHKGNTTGKPMYHFAPPCGWLNDPNGFCYYQGEYHLFYQSYPYDVVWNDMHWGHAASNDLVHWKYQRTVMANDTPSDVNGVFSGSAVEKDGNLYFLYTGYIDPTKEQSREPSKILQYQNLAMLNKDGSISKYEHNPVITEQELPPGYRVYDFRDPKVYKRDGRYYALLSVRNPQNCGSILLFQSTNLINWEFFSDIYASDPKESILFECPDLISFDTQDLLIYSIMPAGGDSSIQVENRVAYSIGRMNYKTGKFEEQSSGLVDYGSSFYAPQTTLDRRGNPVIVGWLCERASAVMPYIQTYGYQGIMSLVRELSIEQGRLISKPTRDILTCMKQKIILKDVAINETVELPEIGGNQIYLKIKLQEIAETLTISLFAHKQLSFDFLIQSHNISYKSGYAAKQHRSIPCNKVESLEFFIDTHVIELFVNGGEQVITELCYDADKPKTITFTGSNELISSITQQPIEPNTP